LNTGVIPKAGMQAAVKGWGALASQSCADNGRSEAVSGSIGWKRRIGSGTPGHRSLSRQCTGPSAPMGRRSPTGALLGFDRNPGQRRASSGFPALRVSGQDGLTTHPASPSGRNLDRGPRLRPTGERHRTVSPVRRPLHATKTTRSPRLQPWRPQTKAEVLDSLPGHASDGASGGRLGDFRNTGDHPL
jgi:hypothetical protein